LLLLFILITFNKEFLEKFLVNKVVVQRRILITAAILVLLSAILIIVIISIAVQDIALPASITFGAMLLK